MPASSSASFTSLCLKLLVPVWILTGCSHPKEVYREEVFRADAPFSKKIAGSGDIVCWSVKHAFLSQGYMLERSSDPAVLIGTRDFQRNEDMNVTLRMQTTCADNHDGSSLVFASALQETSKLQAVTNSLSAGVGPATFSWPSGSSKALAVVKRETIQDPTFYQRFFNLVQRFADEEKRAPGGSHSADAAQPDVER
jgi:uncharacterized protein DUF2242